MKETFGLIAASTITADGDTHVIATIPVDTGLKVYNFPFHFEITPDQFRAALPNDLYSANVVFTCVAP